MTEHEIEIEKKKAELLELSLANARQHAKNLALEHKIKTNELARLKEHRAERQREYVEKQRPSQRMHASVEVRITGGYIAVSHYAKGLIAAGNTPEEALKAFDKAWYGE